MRALRLALSVALIALCLSFGAPARSETRTAPSAHRPALAPACAVSLLDAAAFDARPRARRARGDRAAAVLPVARALVRAYGLLFVLRARRLFVRRAPDFIRQIQRAPPAFAA